MKKTARNLVLAATLFASAGMTVSAFAQAEAPAAAAPRSSTDIMAEIAPKLGELTADMLYADIWARTEISPRDRSLVTISALIALNRPDQLRSHIRMGLTNGLTEQEIIEAITHLAFYSGWPNAVSALQIADEFFAEEQ